MEVGGPQMEEDGLLMKMKVSFDFSLFLTHLLGEELICGKKNV